VAGVNFEAFQELNCLLAGDEMSEDDVDAVQMRRRTSRDEKLRSVGVFAAVGHGQQVGPIVLHLEIFIRKGSTVNRLATFAVAVRDIATLDHEIFNDSVKWRPFVVKRFSRYFADALVAIAKGPEVLARARRDVAE